MRKRRKLSLNGWGEDEQAQAVRQAVADHPEAQLGGPVTELVAWRALWLAAQRSETRYPGRLTHILPDLLAELRERRNTAAEDRQADERRAHSTRLAAARQRQAEALARLSTADAERLDRQARELLLARPEYARLKRLPQPVVESVMYDLLLAEQGAGADEPAMAKARAS